MNDMARPAEVEALARKLTDMQRAAVVNTLPGARRPYSEVHGIPRMKLFQLGILESCKTSPMETWDFQLTPLGVTVRECLLEKRQ